MLRAIVLTFLVVLLIGSPARAERIDHLIQILKKNKSHKVRSQAVIFLGKIKDRKAVPALIDALSDRHDSVRSLAVVALVKIGDRSALPALKKLAAQPGRKSVRKQAARAILILEGKGSRLHKGTRFYFTVGKLNNKSGRGGAALGKDLARALLESFSRVEGVAVKIGQRDPSGSKLRQLKVKGFVLDGAIVSLDRTWTGEKYRYTCKVKIAVATYPANSMKAFYSGESATAVVPKSHKPGFLEPLYRQLIVLAAEDAKEHVVNGYLVRFR